MCSTVKTETLPALPCVPSNWTGGDQHAVTHRKLTSLRKGCLFERVGKAFHAHVSRVKRNRTLSEDENDAHLLSSASGNNDDEDVKEAIVDLSKLKLSYEKVKDQDHYKVMGLDHLRYKATDEDIKRAYKRLVLKYHPDKQGNAGEDSNDIFKCLQVAFEQISDPERRRAYDSVDPEFDDYVPAANKNSKKNFFEVFGEVVESNARWSVEQPVPLLGDMETPFEEVEQFYNFWYDFQSWREFSYLDEEDTKNAECREEKRWLDRKNKTERTRRKKEDNARLIELVENLIACDPRIAKHKEEEKQKKEAAKKAKDAAAIEAKLAKARAEEEAKRAEQERLEKEKLEQQSKKKDKEAIKKAIRKERKTFRRCCQDNDYFVDGNEDARIERIEAVEKLCQSLSMEEMREVNGVMAHGVDDAKSMFEKLLVDLKSESDISASVNASVKKQNEERSLREKENVKESTKWGEEEVNLLILAVKAIPVGSHERYEKILEYITTRIPETKLKTKDIIKRVNEMKKVGASSLQEEKSKINDDAFGNLEKRRKRSVPGADCSETVDFERARTLSTSSVEEKKPWSPEEQKLLEGALKQFPASHEGRWEAIAEAVSTRSKKECMIRYKELAEIVKAKKAATK
eukprot:Nk52_evm52s239 gene=Nk52_evmTU52s239